MLPSVVPYPMMMPNCRGEQPMETMSGRRMGVMMRTMGPGSMKVPMMIMSVATMKVMIMGELLIPEMSSTTT